MRIKGHDRQWDAHDEAALERVLRFRDDVGGALFWLAPDDDQYPAVAIRVSGELADVHYFPEEGHPGFRALAELSRAEVQGGAMTTLVYEGCDPATGEETPSEFVLPVSRAIDLAAEFYRTGGRSPAISWLEL
jgi:hypothetical protein